MSLQTSSHIVGTVQLHHLLFCENARRESCPEVEVRQCQQGRTRPDFCRAGGGVEDGFERGAQGRLSVEMIAQEISVCEQND